MVILNLIQDLKLKLKIQFFFHAAIEMPIIAHGKLSVLRAYNTARKYDVICISESYLDSAAPLDDNSLSLNG